MNHVSVLDFVNTQALKIELLNTGDVPRLLDCKVLCQGRSVIGMSLLSAVQDHSIAETAPSVTSAEATRAVPKFNLVRHGREPQNPLEPNCARQYHDPTPSFDSLLFARSVRLRS